MKPHTPPIGLLLAAVLLTSPGRGDAMATRTTTPRRSAPRAPAPCRASPPAPSCSSWSACSTAAT